MDKNSIELKQNMNVCIEMFNNLLLDVTKTISDSIENDFMLKLYEKTIIHTTKSSPNEPISKFLIHICNNDNYRKNIVAGNDSFFINSVDIDIKDKKDIDTLFKFRKYWTYMNDDTKKYIKESMKTMIKIADQYIKYFSKYKKS